MANLAGKRALIIGVANEHSIAWGCAEALRQAGAELAITFLNEKVEPHVRPLADRLGAVIVEPLDVSKPGEDEALFARIAEVWGGLDILLHSIAYCPKDDLHGRVVDCSREGFAMAMDVSVHSFLRLLRLSEPLMPAGGSAMTVSFHGAQRVVDYYNIMGPVKAALEAAVRYAAAELGPHGIRVNALSPGPLSTRAASGIDHFDEMLADAAARAPTHQLATIEDVGHFATFLAGDGAAAITGGVHAIDGGYSIVA